MDDYPRNINELEARFSSEEACRAYMFRLRWPEGFRCPRCGGSKAWPFRSVRLECGDCGHQTSVDRGDDLPGHPQASGAVVPHHVVGDESEEWGQRVGSAESAWIGKLQDGLDVVAQVAASHGPPRTRSAHRQSRGGRDLRGWIGRGGSRAADGDQSFGSHFRSRRWRWHRTHPHAPDLARLGPEPGAIYHGEY